VGEAPAASEPPPAQAALVRIAAGVPLAMNGRDVDLDDLFDRDADGRLLERRRREELGLARSRRRRPTPCASAESMINEDVRPTRAAPCCGSRSPRGPIAS